MERNRGSDMLMIFNELSEQNKDIVLLIAKSVQVAQEAVKQPLHLPKPDSTATRA